MATLTTTIQYSEPAGTIITALGVPGPSGPGVPVGGAAGQILAKIDSADYNTHWITPQDDSAIWGQITGDIANQLDLSAALSLKLDVSTAGSTYYLKSNPDGFITSSALAPYLLSSTASATYQTLSGMADYLSKAGNLAGIADPLVARANLGLGEQNDPTFAAVYTSEAPFSSGLEPSSVYLNGPNGGNYLDLTNGLVLEVPGTGIRFPDASIQVTAFNTSLLAPYLTITNAAATYAVIARGLPAGGNTAQVLTKSSNVDYASTWTTIIPGDRYLTSSTTPNTVSNGAKTFAVQTGLSYTPTQDVTISYDSNNHMHAVVTSYNTATGILVVNVNHHTGSGTYSSWVVNVGGTVPAQTVAWGSITGTISSQLDLQEQLDTKLNTATAASTYYLQTNPAGFITSSALAPYLLASTAASTYLTQASAASTYFTISSAAGKANLSGATFTGKINLATINAASPSFNLGGQCDSAPASATNGDVWVSNAASPKLTYRAGGINFNVPVLNQFNTFTGQMVINTTSSSTAALRVTQLGTANAIEVEDSTTPDATRFAVDQFGKVGIGVAPDATAALKVDTNGIMFGDGTTQTTAAVPPGPPGISTNKATVISVGSCVAAACSNFVANSSGGPDKTYFTFNITNQNTLGLMLYGSGITNVVVTASSVGFPTYETITCNAIISGSGTTVTTDDYYWQAGLPTGATYDVRMAFAGGGDNSDFYVQQISI
jgi:hypothetical protein